MDIIVQKYGGKSVADAEKIKGVADRIIKTKEEGNHVVVVVSAPGSTTDNLVKFASEITDDPSPREMDRLLATGEMMSIALMAMALQSKGHDAISFSGRQVGIKTDVHYSKAAIESINDNRILEELENGKIVVVAGFQGVNIHDDITTLGRGGSDTTAVALAAVLKAKMCEIYTDVKGIYTADPKLVPEARKLPNISYDEMLELASMGSKVMQLRSMRFAKKFEVPIHVRSSFYEETGTMITKEVKSMEQVIVSGVANDINQAKVSLLGVPDKPGIASRLFNAIAEGNIIVDMIIQNVAENNLNDISFSVEKSDFKQTKKIAETVALEIGAKEVVTDEKVAKVSVVGVGMRSHAGVAATMFDALANAGINIDMISTSEIKISCMIREDDMEKAVKVIHEAFELDKEN